MVLSTGVIIAIVVMTILVVVGAGVGIYMGTKKDSSQSSDSSDTNGDTSGDTNATDNTTNTVNGTVGGETTTSAGEPIGESILTDAERREIELEGMLVKDTYGSPLYDLQITPTISACYDYCNGKPGCMGFAVSKNRNGVVAPAGGMYCDLFNGADRGPSVGWGYMPM